MYDCKTYSVKEVSLMLGVSESKVYQLVRKNKIPNLKLDKCYLIPRIPFDEWLEKSIQGGNMSNSGYINPNMYKLGEYLLQWLDNYSAVKELAENTYNGYLVNIKNHINPVLGDLMLDEVTPEHTDMLLFELRKKGLSGTSQRYVLAVLHKAFETARKRRLITYNVVELIDKPKKNLFESEILNQEQVVTFINSLNQLKPHFSIALQILICLGCRRGEMLGLKWSDINFDTHRLRIVRSATPAKGGYHFSDCKTTKSRRELLIPDMLYDSLAKWKIEQAQYITSENASNFDYVLCQPNGTIVRASSLNKQYKKLLEKNGLPNIRIHDLRHSWTSLMAKNNVPVKVVSEMLGHSKIQTTLDIYTHNNIQMQESAIGVINGLL